MAMDILEAVKALGEIVVFMGFLEISRYPSVFIHKIVVSLSFFLHGGHRKRHIIVKIVLKSDRFCLNSIGEEIIIGVQTIFFSRDVRVFSYVIYVVPVRIYYIFRNMPVLVFTVKNLTVSILIRDKNGFEFGCEQSFIVLFQFLKDIIHDNLSFSLILFRKLCIAVAA